MLRLVIPVIALLIGAALVGVSDRALPPASYSFAQKDDFFTLDPQRMSFNQDLRICYSLYEGLTRWDNETFEILPAAAQSWEVSPDKRTYTFHLRAEARWSNGDPVGAGDFVYAWKRAILPDTASDYTQVFFLIEGAEEFFRWRSGQLAEYAARAQAEKTVEAARELRAEAERTFAEMVAIEAPDAHTLRVTLARPTPYFLDLCCFAVFHPVHPATVERWVSVDPASGRVNQRHDWTKPPRLVSNGPMTATRWRFKRDLRLERNPFYWNPAMVKPDSVEVVIISNPNTAVLAYQTGAVDWVEEAVVDYVPEMLLEVKRGERRDLIGVPNFGTYFWSFNCRPLLPDGRPNPFADARVRRAFAMATNKRDISEKVRRQDEPPTDVLIPPGTIAGFDPGRRIGGAAFDPIGARALLAEAGWVDRDGDGVPENARGVAFPVVEMLSSTGSFHEDVALAMGAMWREALGVATRVERLEGKVFRDRLKRQDYVVARGGWYGDYGDPSTFLHIHETGDGNNDRGYSDPVFDDLMRRAGAEADESARMRLLEEAERYTMQESLPILPLFHYVRYYMFDPERLKGVSTHPRITQYLWKIEKVAP